MNQSQQITQTAIDFAAQGKFNYFDECFAFAKKFVQQNETFTSEDIIEAYDKTNAPKPKEKRVWGSVMREIMKLGMIKKTGITHYRNPSGHCKLSNVWSRVGS